MNMSDVVGNGKCDAGQSACSNLSWYALRTRSNCEKIAAEFLEARGIEQFLPLYRATRRWSDRVFENWFPLFPGYLFCRFDARYRTPVVSALGVVSIVSFGGSAAPIDDGEIEAIRKALGSGQNMEPYPYLHEGQKIRIKEGPLQGMEGILIQKRTWRVVISVEMLRRSVAVEIDPDNVFPLECHDKHQSKTGTLTLAPERADRL
jgi:transcription antitermination factor NusG